MLTPKIKSRYKLVSTAKLVEGDLFCILRASTSGKRPRFIFHGFTEQHAADAYYRTVWVEKMGIDRGGKFQIIVGPMVAVWMRK